MVLTLTIFSKSMSQESRSSPAPSGSSELSNPSDGATRLPQDKVQKKILWAKTRTVGYKTDVPIKLQCAGKTLLDQSLSARH